MLKKIKFIILLTIGITCNKLLSQTIPLNNISNITSILSESSGLTFIAPNRLYTHDDSGGNDEIYEIDTLGNLIRTININSANNSDWEDITNDDFNNIYIGDFGNNNNDRTNLRIYKIQSPLTFGGNSITANVISFSFPDQTLFPPAPQKRNFDAEAIVWFNDSIYIFTKNRTSPFNGYCKMYKLPAAPGNYTAELCDSIFLCADSQTDCWVTSAALSPDKSHLALLNNSKIWWFSCFNGDEFFKGAMATVTLSSNTQKEGITFKNNHQVYITDELNTIDNTGGNLYEADLSLYLEMPYVSIIPDSIICDNCTLNVDSFVGALSWSNGLFGSSITPDYTGWYIVTAKNFNNCTVVDSVYISYLQTIQESIIQQINLTLNEVSSTVISGTFSSIPNVSCDLQLTDVSGKLIVSTSFQITQPNQPFLLPVHLKNGLYLLKVNANQINKTYKLVISD